MATLIGGNFVVDLRRDAVKKLGALYTELTGLLNILAEMPSKPAVAHFLSSSCLQLLCHTMYIDVGPQLLSKAYHLVFALEQLRLTPADHQMVDRTREAVVDIAGEVQAPRGKLLPGEYDEPSIVSTMGWIPLSGTAGDSAALNLGKTMPDLARRPDIQQVLKAFQETVIRFEGAREANVLLEAIVPLEANHGFLSTLTREDFLATLKSEICQTWRR